MTSRDFCYWLQGFFELATDGGSETLEPKQVEMIRRHLALVFKHEIDPSAGPVDHQKALNEIHEGLKKLKSKKKPGGPIGGHGPGGILYRC